MTEDLASLPSSAFRQRIRDWLTAFCPSDILRPVDRLQGAEALAWHRLRHAHGLLAPGWPKAFGGLELSVDQQIAMAEEIEAFGVARAFDMGVAMLGPTLIRFGTLAQKAYYLPRILSGEDIWCQGYSEPGAGSDLASLRTAAVRDGDDYVVTGQKIWTSNAHHSTHCFVLVRTSSEGRKQQGISFLLIDLSSPGVTVRPIRNIAGHEELCEVFYDGVRVPVENRVGEEGQGWSIAKSLLGFERLAIGSPAPARLALDLYRSTAAALGLEADALYKEELSRLELRLHALNCLFREAVDDMAANRVIDADLSVLKLVASELFQHAAERLVAMAGDHGAAGQMTADGANLDLRQLFMISRPATIFGGSSEIQRNILAKQWLNLPASL